MKPDQKIPRLQPHYCRFCGAYFGLATTPSRSPHTLCWQHIFEHHRDNTHEYIACSRNCTHREQPEEARTQRRLYGFPAPDKPVLRSDDEVQQVYDTLFPDE